MRLIVALLLALPAVAEAKVEIVVDKTARTLAVIDDGREVDRFDNIRMGDPVGPKHFQGDRKTPEGHYTISGRNDRSAYHLSLRISYPNAADRAYAAAQGASPGGDVFIHGLPNDATEERFDDDWTDGCIALSNAEIERLWDRVPDGADVTIRP